jgi:regulator of replication initiation timing
MLITLKRNTQLHEVERLKEKLKLKVQEEESLHREVGHLKEKLKQRSFEIENLRRSISPENNCPSGCPVCFYSVKVW